ncbi:MAG TPA: CatB-related O-acetyltransferase [Roseimicrobium sp.]|nr:CatB-related O-acetyltransferase [Roseimicrobium sp.]
MNQITRKWLKALEWVGLRRPPFFIRDNPDYSHIPAGEYSYGKPLIMGWDGTPETRVTIGRFCSFADGVRILLRVNHPIHSASTYPVAKILGVPCTGPYEWSQGPVSIGHGAVIAANSVVTEDVPPYGIAAGNPARIVRRRFDEETVRSLLEIPWWDWPMADIRQHAVLLFSGDVATFLAEAGSNGREGRK